MTYVVTARGTAHRLAAPMQTLCGLYAPETMKRAKESRVHGLCDACEDVEAGAEQPRGVRCEICDGKFPPAELACCSHRTFVCGACMSATHPRPAPEAA